MNASQAPNLASESDTPALQDEFASGSENGLRRLVSRLIHWLYHPPYFPNELTWFLLALIGSNAAVELLSQPAGYWVDPSISKYSTFLGTPLSWGVWSLGVYIGYLLLIGLIFSLFNIKPAFAIWIGLSLYHFSSTTNWFRCGFFNFFSFINSTNCSGYHTAALILAGILWAVAIVVAGMVGLIPWIVIQDIKCDQISVWTKSLRGSSKIWFGLMILAVVLGAMVTGTTWHLIETAHAPTGRSSASLAYDTQRAVAVLFGGTTSWSQNTNWVSVNDTWEWNGNDWTELHPTHNPSARYGAGMAFDEKRGVTVLFGGSGSDTDHKAVFNGDTWEWNGQDWLEVFSANTPHARQSPNMFFDPVRETVVIYGGYYFDTLAQTDVFLDDAWEWNGKNWSQITFDESRRNSASAIVYDRVNQFPMLMDAEGLWFWQDSLWVQPNFPSSPPGRWGSQMAYNSTRENIVLFGGYKDKDVFDDTWIYNGQTWQQTFSTSHPDARNGHNLFYDQTRDKVMLFGGINTLTFYNDMWELTQP